jgi:hypothetical protein
MLCLSNILFNKHNKLTNITKNILLKYLTKLFLSYIFLLKQFKETEMSIKIIVGQVATGDDFFNRKNEINILWQRIISGSNIILSAPRRVGKTSLVCAIRDNPRPNFHVIYLITESVNDENEFFKKTYKQVVSELKTA